MLFFGVDIDAKRYGALKSLLARQEHSSQASCFEIELDISLVLP